MAFGLKYIQGAEEDKYKTLQAEQAAADAAARPPSDQPEKAAASAEPDPAPTSDQPRRSRFARRPNPSTSSAPQPATPTPPSRHFRPATHAASAASSDISLYQEALEQEQRQESGQDADAPVAAPSKVSAAADLARSRLVLQARRMLQDLADHQQWSVEQLTVHERRAQLDPTSVLEEFSAIHQKHVISVRRTGMSSLEQAMRTYPNEVVFLLLQAGQPKLVKEPVSKGREILHGAVVQHVPASLTLFPPPSVLFENQDPPEPEPSPVAPSSPAPRP